MIRVVATAALAFVAMTTVAACGPSAPDPVFENLIVKDYPTHNQTATSSYVMDCGTPENGSVKCHACNAEIIVDRDDTIHIYAETDEHTLEGIPANPHVVVQGEILNHNSEIKPAVAKVEKAKGHAAYAKYLTGLYEDANTWCAQFGGKRHETKNVIADVANGKYVK